MCARACSLAQYFYRQKTVKCGECGKIARQRLQFVSLVNVSGRLLKLISPHNTTCVDGRRGRGIVDGGKARARASEREGGRRKGARNIALRESEG